ncbi:MAG: GntR family transcriptional regulator [Planctomycetota bacterium]|nr:GntR family transcriptional regulator [Planctomycetota bacterium]MDA1141499.1 GntR family transcriptional regulator [Planctomycetota bacterium]
MPRVNRLAVDYGVNGRTMVKAIDTLEEQGLVKRVPSKGTFVKPLRRERTHTLSAITDNMVSPLHSGIVHGMEEIAARRNHHLLFCRRESIEIEEARIVELLESRKAVGFLVWPMKFSLDTRGLQALKSSGVPFVVFPHPGRRPCPIPDGLTERISPSLRARNRTRSHSAHRTTDERFST